MNDMRELNEKELLDVSGGINSDYADVTLQINEPPKSCNNHKKKKDCVFSCNLAWKTQSKSSFLQKAQFI